MVGSPVAHPTRPRISSATGRFFIGSIPRNSSVPSISRGTKSTVFFVPAVEWRPMRLYRTKKGMVAEDDGKAGLLKDKDWDALFNHKNLSSYLAKSLKAAKPMKFDPASAALLAPIGTQEV